MFSSKWSLCLLSSYEKDRWRPLGVERRSCTHHHAVKELLVVQAAVLDAARLAQVVVGLRTLQQEVHVCSTHTGGTEHAG